MYPAQLKINTTNHHGFVNRQHLSPLSSSSPSAQTTFTSNQNPALHSVQRLRSPSSASTASNFSLVSPAPSSFNGSSSSLSLSQPSRSPSLSPSIPSHQVYTGTAISSEIPLDDSTVKLSPEFVLAMHDFEPTEQVATCLSFKAGQVIHVLNRDGSGWWDGELDGRRGWFPSNYVNREGEGDGAVLLRRTLGRRSFSRGSSLWTGNINGAEDSSTPSSPTTSHSASNSNSQPPSPTITNPFSSNQPNPNPHSSSANSTKTPSLMIPLLHALSLLQSVVRSSPPRYEHFQPSTACIISTVRSLLAAIGCLTKDSEVLVSKREGREELREVRKEVLGLLGALVAASKRASASCQEAEQWGDMGREKEREEEVEKMLKMGGAVFANVRRLLAVAVQSGVELPERLASASNSPSASVSGSSPMAMGLGIQGYQQNQDSTWESTPREGSVLRDRSNMAGSTPHVMQDVGLGLKPPRANGARAKSTPDLKGEREQRRLTVDDDSTPLLPHRDVVRSKRDQYLPDYHSANNHSQNHRRNQNNSIDSITSSTSSADYDTSSSADASADDGASRHPAPGQTPFPFGPSSPATVLSALKTTHTSLLSLLSSFISHAHAYSRFSHASSVVRMCDLCREVVGGVCKLLALMDGVQGHPGVPRERLEVLGVRKGELYNVCGEFVRAVGRLASSDPNHRDGSNSNTNNVQRGKEGEGVDEEEERKGLLKLGTEAAKVAADGVGALRVCLHRVTGETRFMIHLPSVEQFVYRPTDTQSIPKPSTHSSDREKDKDRVVTSKIPSRKTDGYSELHRVERDRLAPAVMNEEDMAIQARSPSPDPRKLGKAKEKEKTKTKDVESDETTSETKSSSRASEETRASSVDEPRGGGVRAAQMPSPVSEASSQRTEGDRGTLNGGASAKSHWTGVGSSSTSGRASPAPSAILRDDPAMLTKFLRQDHAEEDVMLNADGHIVGATLDVLVEKMTPHDSLVDPAFSAVFFLTFRLFCTPMELVEALVCRYNLETPPVLSQTDAAVWQKAKGLPIRLRVANFIKLWVEMYWRNDIDGEVSPTLKEFTQQAIAPYFVGPAQRILELLTMRTHAPDQSVSPKGDRIRDPGMNLNPPAAALPSEVPRPRMHKSVFANLKSGNFSAIAITDFDPLELARQLTIMESRLYCAIPGDEVLQTGVENAKTPVNVRALSGLSTSLTGWVAETILAEKDIKKRTALIKFFIKVADRCSTLHNYSTTRSILAALDSSTISRLQNTWAALPTKSKVLLESLRRLASHERNFREYRQRLRNTAPPAVPFLGIYLTDITFCREGNPTHRASPLNEDKQLLNFNKFHKLARIVQDMQRFQVPYNLQIIPQVHQYLKAAFEGSKTGGDMGDLYRRSLMVEPRRTADAPGTSDMRQLFNWATRATQSSQPSP